MTTATQTAAVTLNAEQIANRDYERFDPSRYELKWNADETSVTITPLRWHSEASYVEYQGDRTFARSERVLCLACGEDAYEVQLCRDDFALYLDWKDRIGDRTSTNRVAEFVSLPMDEVAR